MKRLIAGLILLAMAAFFVAASGEQEKDMGDTEYRELTPEEEAVIVHKGTERPFTGEYYQHFEEGTYHCKRCDAPLYRSTDKFSSGCGWPSFDDEIEGAVRRQTDADGVRTEILCANCGAHLGHVFEGENLTDKNTRHCVNSVSMVFVPEEEAAAATAQEGATVDTARAYFAGGCFWGVEYHFEKEEGVVSAVSGYMGGSAERPSYEEVCSGRTGHLETVRVEYDPSKVTYEELARLFFEIHDPTQASGQGPDIGSQYLSAVFYETEEEKETIEKLIGILEDKGYDVATKVLPADEFWPAEDYHQDYYERKGHKPYCHAYEKRF
ncbi:MAG: bifunctional methionine sulfoxide reductase B/A protein [Candidatus Eisenbacteria bacterium]|nr:bifunctional methionine sulfoxide reductase B/A protein [Candidatus Eisenbacteria bacterium]